jgi:Tfp pilus assembly protein PilN
MVTEGERERIVAEVLARLEQRRREQLRFWASLMVAVVLAAATVVLALHAVGVL